MITQWRRLHEGAGGLAAWAMGEGPVVLASHGIEDNWRNWTRLATRLADRFQIVAQGWASVQIWPLRYDEVDVVLDGSDLQAL